MNILYWYISKIGDNFKRILVIVLIYLTCFYFNAYLDFLPFGIFTAAISLLFFEVGHQYRPYLNKSYSAYKYIIVIAVAFAVQLLLHGKALSAWRVDETSDNPLYSLALPFAGIALYTSLATLIKKSSLLEWFGKNSLVIFAFHAAVLRVVLAIMAYILKQPVLEVRCDILYSIVATVVTLLILYPICICWNKWLNPQLGKVYSKIIK